MRANAASTSAISRSKLGAAPGAAAAASSFRRRSRSVSRNGDSVLMIISDNFHRTHVGRALSGPPFTGGPDRVALPYTRKLWMVHQLWPDRLHGSLKRDHLTGHHVSVEHHRLIPRRADLEMMPAGRQRQWLQGGREIGDAADVLAVDVHGRGTRGNLQTHATRFSLSRLHADGTRSRRRVVRWRIDGRGIAVCRCGVRRG